MKSLTRVLHIGKYYPPERGGMETHLATLCRGLRRYVDVHVLVAHTRAKTERDAVDGISVIRAARVCEAMATPLCPSLVSEIRNSRPDLVHLHWPNPMAVVALLTSGYNGPLIVTYHSDVIRQKLTGKVFAPLLDRLLSRCQAIIATSPNYIGSSPVLSKYQDMCHVVPLGITRDYFAAANPQAMARLREEHGSHIVLSVGRLVYYKGFEYLIRAMASVNGKLLIVGDGPLKPQLLELRRSLGLEEKVVFLGNPSDEILRACYHEAKVFALASVARSEAFGIVQVEAMAAGVPVVNTNLPTGVPFVSVHGATGLTVEPADASGMSAALSTLLESDTLRREYGAAARRRAETVFSADVMVEKTMAVYREVLGIGKRPEFLPEVVPLAG
jgi:rhamnosyl/mannosyltransferase